MKMREKVKVYRLYHMNFIHEDIVTGTIKDVRIFMKNRWEYYKRFVKGMLGFDIEEDYYTYLDDDANLRTAMGQFSYIIQEICEVSIDDFMD